MNENYFYDNRPQTREELRSKTWELPVIPGVEVPPKRIERYVKDYYRISSALGKTRGLVFVRTALVDGVEYYLWKHKEEGEYYYHDVYEGSGHTGCQEIDGFTPEQFILKIYLGGQWGIKLE